MPRRAGGWVLVAVFVVFAVASPDRAAAQGRARTDVKSPPSGSAATTVPEKDQTPSTRPRPTAVDAEKISRIQGAIDADQATLQESQAKLERLDGMLRDENQEMSAVRDQIEAKEAEAARLRTDGTTESAAKLGREVNELTKRLGLAREKFELTVKERKTLQEQIVLLEQKISRDRLALDGLLGKPMVQTDALAEAASPTAATASQATPASPPAPSNGAPKGLLPPDLTLPSTPAADPIHATLPPSGEVLEARKTAAQKESEAAVAEAEVESVDERIESLQQNIELERTLLDTARQRQKTLRNLRDTVTQELSQKRGEKASDEAALLEDSLRTTEEDFTAVAREIQERRDRLSDLQSQLAVLQEERIITLQEAAKKRADAEDAREEANWLDNPFTIRNILQWLILRGPRVLAILLATAVLLWIARFFEHRFVSVVANRTHRGTRAERENRAQTLVGVFHHTSTLAITIGCVLAIANEMGLNVTAIVGGMAVLGLAIAFGIQNLMRDYFSGFVILMESQYAVNDVVKIGNFGGLVERVTLRLTQLRDLDGTVHFIPNGQISTVSNLTHGWSRAVFDIPVAMDEDIDRAGQVLLELGKQLRSDPAFRDLILDDPEMLGVETFTDSALVLRLLIKTRPLRQWTVKREMLRRIKKRFDAEGIEIPFPTHVVYQRPTNGARREDTRELAR